eukprot:gene1651-33044_t
MFMKLQGKYKAMGKPSSYARAKKWPRKASGNSRPTSFEEDSVVGTPDGQRGSISGTPKGSWFGRASPTGSSFTAPTDLGPLGPPATPASEKDSLDSPSSVKGKRQGSRFFVFPSSPSAVARQSLAVAPVFQWRGNRETMPPGPSVISFDAGLGRLQVSGSAGPTQIEQVSATRSQRGEGGGANGSAMTQDQADRGQVVRATRN